MFLFLLYLFLRNSYKRLSFSIRISVLGFFLIISSVKKPLPGPISTTSLFLISTRLTIFFLYFDQLKNFGLKIF